MLVPVLAIRLATSHEVLLCRVRGPGDLDRYGTWWGGTDVDLEEQIIEVLSLHRMCSVHCTACQAGQHNDAQPRLLLRPWQKRLG